MKENHKDILYFSLINMGVTYAHMVSVMVPYYLSYYYLFDESITFSSIYYANVFYSVGVIFSYYINDYYFAILGIRAGVLVYVVLNFLITVY